jgi:hypothetical protein
MNPALDAAQVDASLALDAAWIAGLRKRWLELIDAAVWEDPALPRLGDAPRLRKRLLELGERLHGLAADRAWIPHPRERLKSALAAALGLRETLAAVETLLAVTAPDTVAATLRRDFDALCSQIDQKLPALENAWARLLDAQLDR